LHFNHKIYFYLIVETEKQANLVETYKHCQRAYYDTLDLYVLDISHTFQFPTHPIGKK